MRSHQTGRNADRGQQYFRQGFEGDNMMFEKEGVAAIKAIDNELKRLHYLLGLEDEKSDNNIWSQAVKLQNTLDEIARKQNGLEY